MLQIGEGYSHWIPLFKTTIRWMEIPIRTNCSAISARKNLLIAYSEAARYYGETMGDTDKALRLIPRATRSGGACICTIASAISSF